MRLTRDDVTPVLAIVLGGTLSLVAISGVVVPRWYQARVEVYIEYEQQDVDVEVPEIELPYEVDMLPRSMQPGGDLPVMHIPLEIESENGPTF